MYSETLCHKLNQTPNLYINFLISWTTTKKSLFKSVTYTM